MRKIHCCKFSVVILLLCAMPLSIQSSSESQKAVSQQDGSEDLGHFSCIFNHLRNGLKKCKCRLLNKVEHLKKKSYITKENFSIQNLAICYVIFLAIGTVVFWKLEGSKDKHHYTHWLDLKNNTWHKIALIPRNTSQSDDTSCCICTEESSILNISPIPCFKQDGSVNHPSDDICEVCIRELETTLGGAKCPLCRSPITTEDAKLKIFTH